MGKIKSLLIFVLLVAVLLLAFRAIGYMISTRTDPHSEGAITVLGMQTRIVGTGSMEKCEQTDVSGYRIKSIRAGAMILIRTVPKNAERAEKWYAGLKVGDVLTFRYAGYSAQALVITHRIVDIEKKETGGYLISLEGDNKGDDGEVLTQIIDTSATDTGSYVIGKVIGKSYLLGRSVTLLRHPLALTVLMLIPIILIFFSGVAKKDT